MKKILIMVFFVFLLITNFPYSLQPSGDPIFTQPRFYFYGMGNYSWYFPSSWSWYSPSSWDCDLYIGKTAEALTPLLGAGFTFLNFWDRGYVNIEFDYTTAKFNTNVITNRRVDTLSINLITDWRLDKKNIISAFGGLGMALLFGSSYNYLDFKQIKWKVESELELAVNLLAGIKVKIQKNIFVRSEIRLYFISSDSYSYSDEGELRLLSSLLGLEFVF